MKHYENMTREELVTECRAINSQLSLLKKGAVFSQELLNVIPTPVFIKDIEGTYLSCNAAFEDFLDLPQSEIVGRKSRDIAPVELAAKYEEMDQRLIRDGGRQIYEHPVRGRDGELRLVRFHKSVYYNNKGEVEGLAGQIFDITELDNARRQAEVANQTKSIFLANMSHDLRTPINGIMGALQLLQMELLKPAQQGIVDTGIKSCRRLTGILSDILDFSRLEAAKVTLASHPFNLKDVLRDVAHMFKLTAEERKVRFSYHYASGVPDSLIGDEHRFSQILMNLVGNAIKFSKDCEVRVEVTATHYLREKTLLLIIVSDSGEGIADVDLSTLFDMFSQVNPTSAKRGAGIGLAIVKQLVRLMGGGICVSSQKDIGTTFYTHLPFKVPDHTENVNVVAKTERPKNAWLPFKALVVEDDNVNQLIISSMLINMGGQVDQAFSGEEGLATMRTDEYDIVFMDVQLPGMDGIEVTRMLRNEPEFSSKANIPVIAMTAFAMAGDKEKYLATGMNDFIAKPVEMDKLVATLEKYLAKPSERQL